MSRPVYRRPELLPLVHPSSIAVIGATQRPNAYGHRVVQNLAQFDGPVYPVNPRYDEVAGRPCYATVGAIAQVPDCAVILTDRDSVEGALADCVQAGVRAVFIGTSGFAETRMPEHAALQARLLEMVRGTRTRMLGPNCMGLCNYLNGALMTFGRMPARRPLGTAPIAVITQSGGLSASLAQSMEMGASVSHAISIGNAADVGIPDLIAYMVDEPSCSAIACTFEGILHADRFMQAAELARQADKPLIVYKMGVGERGAMAALSHTGSIAGTDAGWEALFERAGVVAVRRLEDIVETARFFAKAGRPTGTGVAVASSSGGCVVMAADMAEAHGVGLPPPGAAAREVLQRHVPEYGTITNPIDFTGTVASAAGGPAACADALLADPQYSTLVVTTVTGDAASAQRQEQYDGPAHRHGKVMCLYWASSWADGPGARQIEEHPRIALFRSLDRCFATLAAWHARERVLARPHVPPAPRLAPGAKDDAARMLCEAPHILAERKAKAALAIYGIPVVGERLARSGEEAASAAGDIGFPVAMKVESADIPHKTEAGVIRLGLADARAVREAYAVLMDKALTVTGPDRIEGVLVQPMVPAGLELVMGARMDPVFGPLVMVGLGGVLVEVLADTAVGLAPVTREEALSMLAKLKGSRLLDGFRGGRAADRERLADILCRLSEFAADHADALAEIDINPLICAGEHVVAVDALIVKAGRHR